MTLTSANKSAKEDAKQNYIFQQNGTKEKKVNSNLLFKFEFSKYKYSKESIDNFVIVKSVKIQLFCAIYFNLPHLPENTNLCKYAQNYSLLFYVESINTC